MGKKKIISAKTPTKPQESSVKSIKTGIFGSISFFKNFILAVFVGFFFLILFNTNDGYSWILRDLIGENLKFIYKNPNITTEQKFESKFGADAYVINQIKKSTPENAVILFPPYEYIINDTSQIKFKRDQGGIKVRNWLIYYLYPRRIEYLVGNQAKPNPSQKITHVVCLNGWGYNYLTYPVSQQQLFEILPLSK